MDLSKLSDSDLLALQSGKMANLSDAGLQIITGGAKTGVDAIPTDGYPKVEALVEPAKRNYSLKEVPVEAIKNIPASAGRFAGGLAQMVAHPIDTASNLIDLGAGTLRNLTPTALREVIDKADNPEQQQSAQKASNMASTVGAALKDRYGSAEGIKRTIAEDPVGVAADVSALASGGASLTSKLPTVSNALQKTAAYTNPLTYGAAAVAPVATKVGETLSGPTRSAAEWLMKNALKPTPEDYRTGKAAIAIKTLLDEPTGSVLNGMNPTRGGAEKLRELITSDNKAIEQQIAGSNARIPKTAITKELGGVRDTFATQLGDTAPDLQVISKAEQGFMNNPKYTGPDISVQDAQKLKQGTYKILDKKYGKQATAEEEAQKAMARAAKDEIAAAVPDVAPLNAHESALITTLSLAQKRAFLEANKKLLGISPLAHNPGAIAAYMADRSALLKSIAARGLNAASQPNKLSELLKHPSYKTNTLANLLQRTQPETQE